MFLLGGILEQRGRTDEAETWWRRAADAGHPGAMSGLAYLLAMAGRVDAAETWRRRAAAAGEPGATPMR
jgi:Flp pilus assembly protein TadD